MEGDNVSNCSVAERFDSTTFKVLAGLRASVGFISFLCCLVVVFVIIFFKKYKHFSQRLVLNVAIAALIHSFSYTTARVNYYTVREIDDPYCYFGGMFNHYTAAVELISIWFTTINIFSVGMFGKNISKFEPVYYLVTYLLPSLWFWVPVFLRAYGTTGGWCGIKSFNADCTRFSHSTAIQFGIWFIPLYISTFIIIIALVSVAIKILYSIHRWKGTYDPVKQATKQALKKEVSSLVWYPIIYLFLNMFSFISQIYRAINGSSSLTLSFLRVFTSPFRGAFIAVAFTLASDTRRRCTPAQCRAACQEWKQSPSKEIDLIESTTVYSTEEPEKGTAYVSYEQRKFS